MRNRLVPDGLVPGRLVLALAILAGGASAAAAQTTVAVPGGYVTFTPAQRQYIESYVVRHPVPPAPVPGGFVAAVGEVVPPGVELRRFDAPAYGAYGGGYARPGYEPGYGYDAGGYNTAGYDAGGYDVPDAAPAYGAGDPYAVSGYRYVVLPGNEAAVVEPRSRRIILILE